MSIYVYRYVGAAIGGPETAVGRDFKFKWNDGVQTYAEVERNNAHNVNCKLINLCDSVKE